MRPIGGQHIVPKSLFFLRHLPRCQDALEILSSLLLRQSFIQLVINLLNEILEKWRRIQHSARIYLLDEECSEATVEKYLCQVSRFTDGDETAAWAKKAMVWAVGVGLLNGRDNDTLDPIGPATRAEWFRSL